MDQLVQRIIEISPTTVVVWLMNRPYPIRKTQHTHHTRIIAYSEHSYDALNQLIHSGRITRNDMVAYLSGSFGEGGGTSFLEINNVGKVLDAGTQYQLPT